MRQAPTPNRGLDAHTRKKPSQTLRDNGVAISPSKTNCKRALSFLRLGAGQSLSATSKLEGQGSSTQQLRRLLILEEIVHAAKPLCTNQPRLNILQNESMFGQADSLHEQHPITTSSETKESGQRGVRIDFQLLDHENRKLLHQT